MKALLVIDIQQSYISRYDHELIQRINKRITEVHESNWDIVYIRNTKRLRNRVVTEGLSDELVLLSENVFFKEEANAFASAELLSLLHAKHIYELEIIGVDGN